jgi:predicted ATP-grasp superfamily ATP-dependent carboligase
MPDHGTISSLLTKDGLHRMADLHGIPAPQMFQVDTCMDVERIAGQLPYPVIIKPVFSPSWLKPEINAMLRTGMFGGAPKVALCNDAKSLRETYQKIAVYDSRMIIEEVIPGEDRRLVYFCFYMDRQSRPLAIFAGEKLRVLPVGFGSASYVRSFQDPKLEEVSLKLLSGSAYQGLGGIEFKRDSRDGCYKLIEFNARLGMWDSLGMRCGVDIPYIAYCDTLGQPVEPQHKYREGVLWIDFQRDLRAFLIYRKRGQLSLIAWLRSLLGEKDWAVYSPDDWEPILVGIKELLRGPWERLKNKLPMVRKKHSKSQSY